MTDSSQELKRNEVATETLSWVDTPFLHLGRAKGFGVDCVGLVVCIARAVGFHVIDSEWYPAKPIYAFFEKAVDTQTVAVETPETGTREFDMSRVMPGDLLKFSYGRDQQQHIGIVVEVEPEIRFVHAYAIIKKTEVATFERSWSARFKGARRYRELA